MGVCNCSIFCCTLLYVHSSIAIILMGKRELIALLNWSSWYLVMVERLFLAVPRGCLQFVIVVFPDHTHLLFQKSSLNWHLFNSLTRAYKINSVSGLYTGMVLLDLQKAFDTVEHHILCYRLKSLGIDNTDWFMSYLQDRKQLVTVGKLRLIQIQSLAESLNEVFWAPYCFYVMPMTWLLV